MFSNPKFKFWSLWTVAMIRELFLPVHTAKCDAIFQRLEKLIKEMQ